VGSIAAYATSGATNRGQTMSELDRVKQAMCDGEHTDGDLEWAVDEIERLTAEGRVMREYIYSQGLSDEGCQMPTLNCGSPLPQTDKRRPNRRDHISQLAHHRDNPMSGGVIASAAK
jgi:hypothetical protein